MMTISCEKRYSPCAVRRDDETLQNEQDINRIQSWNGSKRRIACRRRGNRRKRAACPGAPMLTFDVHMRPLALLFTVAFESGPIVRTATK